MLDTTRIHTAGELAAGRVEGREYQTCNQHKVSGSRDQGLTPGWQLEPFHVVGVACLLSAVQEKRLYAEVYMLGKCKPHLGCVFITRWAKKIGIYYSIFYGPSLTVRIFFNSLVT